jgi:hypothetical protein
MQRLGAVNPHRLLMYRINHQVHRLKGQGADTSQTRKTLNSSVRIVREVSSLNVTDTFRRVRQ